MKNGTVPMERFVEAVDTGAPLLPPMLAAEAAIEAKDATTEASAALALVMDTQVTTPVEYEAAIAILTEVKRQRSLYEAARKRCVSPLNAIVSSINDWFRPAIEACDSAERHLKTAVMQFQAIAEAERERLLQEAEEQAQGGDIDAAEVAIVEAATAVVPAVGNLSVRTDWIGEVVDASKIPREFLVPDVAKLLAHTKLHKGATKIAGWKAFERKTATVRQKR